MRTLHVVYRDSHTEVPVVGWFKLTARNGVVPVTFRDGSRGIIPLQDVRLMRVEETSVEEDV